MAASVEPVGPEDASGEYQQHRTELMGKTQESYLNDWLQRQGGPVQVGIVPGQGEERSKPLDPFPTNRPPPPHQSTAGKVMRNVGEIGPQIVHGVEEAVYNAFGPLNSAVEWLDANVANLSYTNVRTDNQPETLTGKLARGLSQFFAGFLPASSVLRTAGLAAKMGTVGSSMAAGAMADFAVRSGNEERLSNWWQEAGLPKNVLTDYLAADPNDSAVEGRFKGAVEGVLTGAAAEGLIKAAGALRAARKVATARESERDMLRSQYGEITDEQRVAVIGDASKPLIESAAPKTAVVAGEPKTTPAAVVGGRGTVKAGDQDLYINFARIDKPDDVKNAIATMAQAYSGKINEATRGKISLEETKRMAADLGMTETELLARRRGQPLNAEESLAARQLWTASADNLVKLAKAAASPNAGNLDQFAFRRALATHAAIQSEVLGARTETARALSAWRIPAGDGIEQARAIRQALEGYGGSLESKEMAAKIAILAEQGDKAALSKVVEKAWGAKTFDAVRELWINGLLSSPATHLVNVMSNTAVAFQAILERGVAAKIGQLRGTEGAIDFGEAVAMAYGTLRATKDAFVMASRALKTGETGIGMGKIDLPRDRSISTEALQMASDTGLGRTVDVLGSVINVPGRLLQAEDEFFKTVAYRAELSALSLRQATAEGKQGAELWARVKEIEASPPPEMKIAAQDAATYRTFTEAPGKVGQAFMQLRESAPAFTFVMPFVRTPVNIARYTFERSPLAPLVGQWRADIAAGGARADLALARMSVGTSIMAAALDWADSGVISGKGPKNVGERESKQRQGWQEYSIQVGGKWYSYGRLDPYGALLGFAADAAEAIRNGEMNQDDVDEWTEVLAMGIGAVSQVAVNKTYLKGMSDFFAMMHDGTRYGPKYVENLLASFVPFTALSGAVERAVDPVLRESNSPWDAINAKLAGLSEKLPPKLTLWGDEIRVESGIGKAYDFFSPVKASSIKPNPVDMEINRLSPLAAADNVEGGFQRIGKRTSFMGIEVNFKDYPEAYTEYVRLAGNAVKDPATGLGAKDLLNETVQGKGPLGETYKRAPDIDRIKLISTVITKYRKLAQIQLLQDPRFADFAQHLDATRQLIETLHQQAPAGVVQ